MWSDQLFTRIGGIPSWADRGYIARLALLRPKREGRISGGSVAQTQQLDYDGGGVAIRKTFSDDDDGKRAASAEYLSSLVSDVVGAMAPAVVKDPTDPEHAVIMGRVNGDLGTVHTGSKDATEWGEARYWYSETDAGRRIGLLDVLVGNRDRHSMNWILSNELDVPHPWRSDQGTVRRPIPIDHSETFQRTMIAGAGFKIATPEGGRYTAPVELMAYRGFTGAWLQRAEEIADESGVAIDASMIGGTLAYQDKNPLHPDDIPVLRARLEALRPRFADEDMLEQYTLMMRRFEHLARRAAGTERMFP